MQVDWRCVFPALMTEFKEDGALDLDGTAVHVEASIEAGCRGRIMLGTLGEEQLALARRGDEYDAARRL